MIIRPDMNDRFVLLWTGLAPAVARNLSPRALQLLMDAIAEQEKASRNGRLLAWAPETAGTEIEAVWAELELAGAVSRNVHGNLELTNAAKCLHIDGGPLLSTGYEPTMDGDSTEVSADEPHGETLGTCIVCASHVANHHSELERSTAASAFASEVIDEGDPELVAIYSWLRHGRAGELPTLPAPGVLLALAYQHQQFLEDRERMSDLARAHQAETGGSGPYTDREKIVPRGERGCPVCLRYREHHRDVGAPT